jgi:hypothetical protein
MDETDVILECPVCFDTYSREVQPTTLPCGHTLCLPCYTKILQEKMKRFVCPTCNTSPVAPSLRKNDRMPFYRQVQTVAIVDASEKIGKLCAKIGSLQKVNQELCERLAQLEARVESVERSRTWAPHTVPHPSEPDIVGVPVVTAPPEEALVRPGVRHEHSWVYTKHRIRKRPNAKEYCYCAFKCRLCNKSVHADRKKNVPSGPFLCNVNNAMVSKEDEGFKFCML